LPRVWKRRSIQYHGRANGSMHMTAALALAVLTIGSSTASAPVRAIPLYSVTAGNASPPAITNSTSPVSLSGFGQADVPSSASPRGHYTVNDSAAAGYGLVGASATANLVMSSTTASETVGLPSGLAPIAAASMTIDDILISGPSGSLITTRLNLGFAGSIMLTATPDFGTTGTVSMASETVTSFGPTDDQYLDLIVEGTSTGTFVIRNDGTVTDFPLDGSTATRMVQTSPFTVVAGSVISETLATEVSSGAGKLGFSSTPIPNGEATGSVDFFDPLMFSSNAPLFDLPDGWTANSLDSSCIVNNHFACGPNSPNAVPEPNSLRLFASGIMFMVLSLFVRRDVASSAGRTRRGLAC